MMHCLHSEDEAASPVDQSRFPLTIDFFLANPSQGRIVLFEEGAALRGYALLVPYWSNEFGGTLVVVDELFVTPMARNRGIARTFFRFLVEHRPFEAIALTLEVSPATLVLAACMSRSDSPTGAICSSPTAFPTNDELKSGFTRVAPQWKMGEFYLWRISSGARWRSSGRTWSCHSTGTVFGKKQVLLSHAW